MPHRLPRSGCGFTLVEIMVVVFVISVLATLALPAFRKVQRLARTNAIVNDFRVFSGAFETYAHEFGRFPAEAAAGVQPAGMDGRLNKTAWLRKTPIGGQYNWENNQNHFGTRYQAAIAISPTASAPLPLDVDQFTDLERAIDGKEVDWLGGSFHVGTGLVPLYIIQK